MRIALALACLAACGGHGDSNQIDGPGNTIPAMITLRGTVFSRAAGSTPVSAATVRALDPEQHVLATATTDVTGAYALALATNGMSVDVALDAVAPSYVPTHRTFEYSLTADRSGLWMDLMTPAQYDGVYTTSGVTRTTGHALLEIIAADAYGTPLSGAQIMTFDPSATIVYSSGSGPDPQATATSGDGLAYLLDATAGQVNLSATGSFFNSDYSTKAFADQLTVYEMDAGFGGD